MLMFWFGKMLLCTSEDWYPRVLKEGAVIWFTEETKPPTNNQNET